LSGRPIAAFGNVDRDAVARQNESEAAKRGKGIAARGKTLGAAANARKIELVPDP
jgi:hypothetical protein